MFNLSKSFYKYLILTILISLGIITILWFLFLPPNMFHDTALYHVLTQDDKPIWLLDATNQSKLPKLFRRTDEQFENTTKPLPSLEGFAPLNISGSAQFSASEFKKMRELIPNNIVLVDLRQETHFFLDGSVISLYAYKNAINYQRTAKAIINEENKYINIVRSLPNFTYSIACKKKYGLIYEAHPIVVAVNNVMSLADFAKKQQVGYVRFFVLDRHIPRKEEIERFIQFVNTLPPNTWLHFFCRGGKGRTTTFMILYDILKNAKNPGITFEDIIQRHILMGGTNLFAPPSPNMPAWLQKAKEDRQTFLKGFYDFVKNDQTDLQIIYENIHEK